MIVLPKIDWPEAIAWWQIIGGAFGLMAGVLNVRFSGVISAMFFGVIFGVIAINSIRAGRAILRGAANARRLSMITQALQVFSFSFGTFVYRLVLGPYVTLRYGFSRSVTFEWGWTGQWSLWFGSKVWVPPLIALNLLSLVVLFYLLDRPDTVRRIAPPEPAPVAA